MPEVFQVEALVRSLMEEKSKTIFYFCLKKKREKKYK